MRRPIVTLAVAFSLVSGGLIVSPGTSMSADPGEYWCWDAPANCCCAMWQDCVARPTHPNPLCQAGRTPIPGTEEHNCFNVGCDWGGVGCWPKIQPGSVPELPNGIDDDCDGYVDDEQCDGKDNDGDGLIDEDVGSCLMKILFVPLCWEGSQQEFELSVYYQLANFYIDLDLPSCPDNFSHTILSPAQINLSCPSGDDDRRCTGTAWFEELKEKVKLIPGINMGSYDLFVGITSETPCGVIGKNLWSFLFARDDYRVTLAHEIGHCWKLADEYCSEVAGGEQRCSGPGDPNSLGTDLGCDPSPDGCCGQCEGYERCCEGNKAPAPDGKPCNMSYADAGCTVEDKINFQCKDVVSANRRFCTRCYAQLTNPPNRRSASNPNGFVALQCPQHNAVGRQPGLDMGLDVTKDGIPTINYVDTFFGRPGVCGARDRGQYSLEVTQEGAPVYATAFDFDPGLIDSETGPRENVTVQSLVLRAAIPMTAYYGIGQGDPLQVAIFKDGAKSGQTTLNGAPPVAHAGSDTTVECNGNGGTTMTLDGTGSNDPDGDSLSFFWSAPGVSFDDPKSPTPSAFFSVGTTHVSLTVSDGSLLPAATAALDVTVQDTTPPTVQVPADLTLECDRPVPPAPTLSALDGCDPSPSVTFAESRADDPTCPTDYTLTRTWSAQDRYGNSSVRSQLVSVQDTAPPAIQCNAPNTIKPPDAQVSFRATATDNCNGVASLRVTAYDCLVVSKSGKTVDKRESCIVELQGDTIRIVNVGGVANTIGWTVNASDGCGNSTQKRCSVTVLRPRK